MARCDDIKLLLGAFEDAELEPHEMQEVARHVVGCADCEAELAAYRRLGVALRGTMPLPDLNGFASAVTARIERLPAPFPTRVRKFFGELAASFGGALTGGMAAAAVAIVTAVLITPYARQFMLSRHAAPRASQLASASQTPPAIPRLASATPVASAVQPVDDALANPGKGNRPSAVISRLEADNPSVAVWSEPENDTTVIWLPDQSR